MEQLMQSMLAPSLETDIALLICPANLFLFSISSSIGIGAGNLIMVSYPYAIGSL
jgi:hypothetical protein